MGKVTADFSAEPAVFVSAPGNSWVGSYGHGRSGHAQTEPE
jgi:hypothetical protein